MATVSTNDLNNGMTLNLPEGLFKVVDFQHVKPGKGGAFVRTKLKNVRNGAVVDRTYRADEKLEQAIIEKREMQFLYRDGEDYVFMDTGTYDQHNLAAGRARRRDELPQGVRQRGHPALRRRGRRCRPARVGGARSSPRPSPACRATACRAPASRPRSRPATCCRCRLFVNQGDQIKVDTRSGDYITRA